MVVGICNFSFPSCYTVPGRAKQSVTFPMTERSILNGGPWPSLLNPSLSLCEVLQCGCKQEHSRNTGSGVRSSPMNLFWNQRLFARFLGVSAANTKFYLPRRGHRLATWRQNASPKPATSLLSLEQSELARRGQCRKNTTPARSLLKVLSSWPKATST